LVVVSAAVRCGSALGDSAAVSLRRRLRRGGRNAEELIRDNMEQQKRIAMQFPRLRARVTALDDADYYSAPDKSFEFGLDAIFDGLESQLHMSQLAARPESPANGSSA